VRRRSILAFVELAVVGAAAPAAAAAPTPVRILFDERAVCSTPEVFYLALQGRNDHVRLAAPGERAFGVRVRLTRVGHNVRGELSVIHEHGETSARAVEGASCEVVVDALSLTAALALDAVVAEGAQAAEAAAAESATHEANSRSVDAAPNTDTNDDEALHDSSSATKRAWTNRFELGAQAAVAQIVAPHVAAGAGVLARWTADTGDSLSPSIGIGLLHVRNASSLDPGDASVEASFALVSACPLRIELASAELRPCALGVGGFLIATGERIASPKAVTRSWWAAGGLLRTSLRFDRTALELEAGLAGPLFERRFITTPSGRSAGRTPVASPLATLGIAYAF
jgi:hypothetical protein